MVVPCSHTYAAACAHANVILSLAAGHLTWAHPGYPDGNKAALHSQGCVTLCPVQVACALLWHQPGSLWRRAVVSRFAGCISHDPAMQHLSCFRHTSLLHACFMTALLS